MLGTMAIEDCTTCRELNDAARFSISRHLEANARFITALRNNADHPELPALKEAARAYSSERKTAIVRYNEHLAEHQPKTMTASQEQG
jgi:hypothetical protein